MVVEQQCLQCKKAFSRSISPDGLKKGKAKYCSSLCYRQASKTNVRAENNPAWRGSRVGYRGLHRWIQQNFGKAKACSFNSEHEGRFEWANISRSYLRNIDDFASLCVACHRSYDKLKRGRVYQ